MLADDNLVAMVSADGLGVTSSMSCRSVPLASHFDVPSRANLRFRIDVVSPRLEGASVPCDDDDSETLALVGESTNVGDVFGAVRDILLTIFLMIRGEDQPRSSLLRLEVANCGAVGVTGNADFGLEQSLLVSSHL